MQGAASLASGLLGSILGVLSVEVINQLGA